jgi:hypothetical protein
LPKIGRCGQGRSRLMNDSFLDQPMKSVMKTYIEGEILQVKYCRCSHLVRRQRNAVITHCVTIAEKILLVYPKLKTFWLRKVLCSVVSWIMFNAIMHVLIVSLRRKLTSWAYFRQFNIQF